MGSEFFEYEIRKLSLDFNYAYPSTSHIEIEYKQDRPYDVVVFDTNNDYYICVPFRSNIRHAQCYHFKYSKRSKRNQSGLDYSKIVIIKNEKYIGKSAVVDNDEAKELKNKSIRIHYEAFEYVETYVNHIKGTKILDDEKFNRKYKYTTLKYFHSELGIAK